MSILNKIGLISALSLLFTPAQAVQHFTRGGGGGGGLAPTISTIVPTNGGTAGGTTVTITGTNLDSTTAITFGGVSASSFSCTSTSCTGVITPAGSGAENVVATNPIGNSGTLSFTYQDFTQTFVAGTTDPNSNVIGGTELRDLLFTTVLNTQPLPDGTTCSKVAGCPVLLGFTGYWMDNNCISGTQGPQVVALTSSLSTTWYLDTTFPAPAAGCNATPSNFNVVNAAYDYFVTYDGNGNAVSPSVEVAIAGGNDGKVWARNNVLGTWSSFSVGTNTGVSRAFGDHEDDSASAPNSHVDYLLIGNDNDGIHQGTWLASPFSYTNISTPENFCQNWTSGTTCNTTCSPQTVANCTNQQSEWPDNIAVTSGSSNGTTMTLNYSSSNSLQAPLSPNLSQIVTRNIAQGGGGSGCVAVNTGTHVVTAQTSTSITFTSGATNCTYSGASISTPANVVFNWTGAITPPVIGSTVNITGVTGYSGDNPNGNQIVNYSTGTSLQFSSNTDCHTPNTCTGGSITTISKNITGWDSDIVTVSLPNIRVIGITNCPVSSGGNTAGKAAFAVAQMNIWRRVDKGASSFWRLVGVVPYQGSSFGAGFPTGQPQLRGLTCIVDTTKTGGYALIAHIEGDGQMYSMDPNTGIFNVEANLLTTIRSQWGQNNLAYGIDSYNSQGYHPLTLPNGNSYYLFSEGDAYAPPTTQPYINASTTVPPAKALAYTGFWARSVHAPASASSPSYTVFPTSGTTLAKAAQAAAMLNAITPNTPAGTGSGQASGGYGTLGFNACGANCSVMVSTRDFVVSQFPEDNNQVLFFGGWDANTTPTHNTAWIGRAPTSMFALP